MNEASSTAYSRAVSRIASALGMVSAVAAEVASVAIGVMVVVIVVEVVARAIAGPMLSSYTYEVVGYLLILVTFFGAAETLKRGKHIRIDLVIGRLGPRWQSILLLVASLAGLAYLGVFLWYSVWHVYQSYAMGRTVHSLMAPPAFALQAIISFGLLLLVLQLLARLLTTAASVAKGGTGGTP